MKARTRRARAVLRDRRRGTYEGPQIFQPLTGWDLWLASQAHGIFTGEMPTPPPANLPDPFETLSKIRME